MSEPHAERVSEPLVSINVAAPEDAVEVDTRARTTKSTVPPSEQNSSSSDAAPSDGTPDKAADNAAGKAPQGAPADKPRADAAAAKPKKVSPQKLEKQKRLPALDDDGDVGVEKAHIVTRDGKPDLMFMGTLLASAAPENAPKGEWQEYRIYLTNGGKHVFSKVRRSVYEESVDHFEADVFDPEPASMPSQIMRSAREIARAKPLTWMDAATAFFGYDPLAKVLYRKLDVRFEEQIT